MKKWMIATAVSASFALAVLAFAAPDRGPRQGPQRGFQHAGPQDGPHLQRLLSNPQAIEKLGITEEQVSALKAAHLAAQKDAVPLEADVKLAQLELREAMTASPADEAAVMAAIDKAGQARIAVQKARAKMMLQTREILGEETLTQIKSTVRGKMAERMKQRRQDGRGDGPMEGRRGQRPDRPDRGPRPDGPPDAE